MRTIMVRTRFTVGVASVVAVVACKSTAGSSADSTPAASGTTAAQSIPFERLHNSSNSGFASMSEFVIQDTDELTRRWRGIVQGSPDAAMPTVDFATSTVVLVATGSRNTGGHSVRVDSLTSASGATTVHYTVTSPGSRCMSMQMLTAPVEVISLAQVTGAVRFRKRNVSGDC